MASAPLNNVLASSTEIFHCGSGDMAIDILLLTASAKAHRALVSSRFHLPRLRVHQTVWKVNVA